MILPITALYAGFSALILTWLAFGAGSARGKTGISLGDGGNTELLEKIRRHGNASEYVPIALILMAILEVNGAHPYWIHGLGVVLVISRIAHPLGIKADNIGHPLRAIGSGGTALVIFVAAIFAIWQFISATTA